MQIIIEHIIPDDAVKSWIVEYVCSNFEEYPTNSSTKKAIKKGLILVDGIKPKWNLLVEPGMKLQFIEDTSTNLPDINIDFDIIYEDEDLAIINKPAGIEVSGNKKYTLQNVLMNKLTKSKRKDALIQAKPVHRLDYATTGLLLVAKTRSARADLGKQLEKREILKTYIALVSGYLTGIGTINEPIEDKEAISEYQVLSHSRSIKTGWISKVLLSPKTGRTHQLRIHMSFLGHDIIGDKIHSKGPVLKGKGMFLCATDIKFKHPADNTNKEFHIDTPNKFETFIKTQQKNWEKFNFEINNKNQEYE
jgi:RluA family pseudouridine synthase